MCEWGPNPTAWPSGGPQPTALLRAPHAGSGGDPLLATQVGWIPLLWGGPGQKDQRGGGAHDGHESKARMVVERQFERAKREHAALG